MPAPRDDSMTHRLRIRSARAEDLPLVRSPSAVASSGIPASSCLSYVFNLECLSQEVRDGIGLIAREASEETLGHLVSEFRYLIDGPAALLGDLNRIRSLIGGVAAPRNIS